MKHHSRFSSKTVLIRLGLALCLAAGLLGAAAGPAQAVYINWQVRTNADGLGSNEVNDFAVQGNTIYVTTAGDSGGLATSTDGGATFTNLTRNAWFGGWQPGAVAASGSTVYVSSDGGGLFVSTDGGQTIAYRSNKLNNGLISDYISDLFVDGNTLYVATYYGGLSISTDGGKTYTNRTMADGLAYNNLICVFANGDMVYVGTPVGLSISSDGGKTFSKAGELGYAILDLYIDNGILYAGTNYGLYISTDGGKTFVRRTTSDGLADSSVPSVYAEGRVVYTGGSDMSISTNGGNTFTHQDLSTGRVGRIQVDNGRIYAGTLEGLYIGDEISLILAPPKSTTTPGYYISYTVAYSNLGPAPLTNVTIDLPLAGAVVDPYLTYSGITLTPDPGSSYTWRLPDMPQGANGFIRIDGMLPRPLASGPFTRTVTLTADGGISRSSTSTLTIENVAPYVEAGPSQFAPIGQTVTLDGSGSGDANGDPLTYHWRQNDGPAVTLSNAETAHPTFTAPDTTGTLEFALSVSDPLGHTTIEDYVWVWLVNRAPVGEAGTNQTVFGGSLVTLDGSGSSDPDNHTLAFQWTQTSGPAVTLSDPTAAKPTFTAPKALPENPTTLEFTLSVTDQYGLASAAPDKVYVTIAYVEPYANAGGDQGVKAGSLVTLDGTGSSDPDNYLPITYHWTQVGGPAVTLSDPGDARPTFTAPITGTAELPLTFQLYVWDSSYLRSYFADEVVVTVEHQPPESNAGSDQVARAGSRVTLDGSGSDPDNHTPLAYHWTQTGGTPVTLSGADTAHPTFTAPSAPAALTFTLTVSDRYGLADPTPAVVSVLVNQAGVYLPMVTRE